MSQTIARDNSIDFIKGIAILSVIFTHNMPNLHIGAIVWIGQAVPLFLLVSSYLTYKSFSRGKTAESYYTTFPKMFKRIFVPFFVITIIQYIIYSFIELKPDFSLAYVIQTGGIGPGAYYPWLYLQCWLLMPLIIYITDKLSVSASFILFLGISILLEIGSSLGDIDASLYRLLIYRYLFLLYLGCLLAKNVIKLNFILIIGAFISLIFSLLEKYTSTSFEPLFVNLWRGYHWITAFYPVLLFIIIVRFYRKFKEEFYSNWIVLLGNYSYEIFLCQMFVYSITPKEVFIEMINPNIGYILYIIFTTIFSIVPILIYKLKLKKLIFNT